MCSRLRGLKVTLTVVMGWTLPRVPDALRTHRLPATSWQPGQARAMLTPTRERSKLQLSTVK